MTRKLYITDDITNESFTAFSLALTELEKQDSWKEVWIELISDGGEAMAALAFFDRIKRSPCHINIVGFGLVASAATMVFAAGDTRIMGKSAWMMVHEDSVSGMKGVEVHQAESVVKHLRRLETQWCEILSEVTKASAKDWAGMHKKTTYLSAKECIALGLADKILEVK